MQAAGRISQGIVPAIARQSTGQTGTQSPQPAQSISLRSGSSRMVVLARGADDAANGGSQQAGHQVFDHRLLQGGE